MGSGSEDGRMNKQVFMIDLASCTGCYTCMVACKDRLNLQDDINVLKVDEEESGNYPDIKVVYRPQHCFHCEKPACTEACPVDAISKESDGFVKIDEEECIGCGECVEACPFDAIYFSDDDLPIKCDGCADEVGLGWKPVCVRSCPMRALDYLPLEEVNMQNRIQDTDFDDKGIGPRIVYLIRKE
ncbi:4Fe-4S dicluster domain-containing protein [Candidatus Poribacteria bacterium]|nr:4Fe-4S dicluster domain-containing protein [Candidatus Poribacteria bacterium]